MFFEDRDGEFTGVGVEESLCGDEAGRAAAYYADGLGGMVGVGGF